MSTKQMFYSNSIDFYQSSEYLNRPRLRKLLKSAINYPLVTVYGGSGYGKTRALYSFLQGCGTHTTWLQISERDNIETRFWENYANMVSLSWPEAGARLLEIGFPKTDDAFVKFEEMVREAGAISGKYVIVYDDFHLLHNPSILRLIEKTVIILPSNATVILLSRTAPKINLIGMMLRERVFSIHEDVLCFTEDEIAEYFNQLALPVTSHNVRDIYHDTRGWAFAVNLIGRSLRKAAKYERYALEAMKTNIFKLMESEISQTVSDKLWRFLLRISLVDHLAASLVRTLGNDDELVREMELLDAYIRYDFYLDAYMIHHLFLNYLRQNHHILTDDEKRETYKEAGVWCENNDYQADALAYYEKSGDYDAIIRIVSSFSEQVPQDMVRYTLEIFDRTPEDVFLQNPLFPVMNLKLKISLGLLDESSQLVEKYAGEYEARPESPERNHALTGIYGAKAVLRLVMSTYTDVYDFDVYFEKQRIFYDKNPFAVPSLFTSPPAGTWASFVGTTRSSAQEEYIEALSRSIQHTSHVLNGNMYGLDDLARGEICFLRRETDDAEQHLKLALDKARERNQYDIQSMALLYFMRIALFKGNYDDANSALLATEELLSDTRYANRYVAYDIAYSYYHLALGQPDMVPNWLKSDFSPYTHPAFLENYVNRVKAQYNYQIRKYSTLLAFIKKERERQALLFGKIGLCVLEALSLYQLKYRNEAIAALTEAYNLAESNNITIPFIQYAKDMRTLTAAAIKDSECQIPKPWLEDINRKASAFAKRLAHVMSKYRAANNLDKGISLTKREIEIVKDLAQGLSRAEIANSQSISPNTVKMVINKIHEKLNASSLADVIRIALDQKIIS